MNHRHLVLAYILTWVAQLSYAGWILLSWRRAKQAESALRSTMTTHE